MQYAHANFAYYLGTVTTVMACLATIFAFFISAIRIFDALIYMTKVKPADLRRCDVIAFTEGSISTIAPHRMMEMVEENGTRKLRIKGDANALADANRSALVTSNIAT